MEQKVTLKRGLSLPLLIAYALGTIIGAGIYVLIGEVSLEAGSLAPWAFLLAAAIAGFTGYSYAVLSSRYPKSAGEVYYVQEAFGRPWLSTAIGWMVLLTGIVTSAVLLTGFVGYVQVLIPWPRLTIVLATALALTAIAVWGIQESVLLASAITVIEVVGLILVVIWLQDAPMTSDPVQLPAGKQPIAALLTGAFLAFYAFIGFEDLANVAEEARRPKRNLPLAVFGALLIASGLYVLVAWTAVHRIPAALLAGSTAPMADALAFKGGRYSQIISLISIVAIINGVLIQAIMGSRVLYGMASRKLAPAWFGKLLRRTRTPANATVFFMVVVLFLSLGVPLVQLANAASFIILVVFCSVNLALIFLSSKLKMRRPLLSKVIAVVGFSLCAGFLVFKIVEVIL